MSTNDSARPILGSAPSVAAAHAGDVRLQAYATARRRVVVLRCTPAQDKVERLACAEPAHDANKTYAALAGMPADSAQAVLLEDVGLDAAAIASATLGDSSESGHAAGVAGGAWLAPAGAAAEQVQAPASLRVALAAAPCDAAGGAAWRVVVLRLADAGGSLAEWLAPQRVLALCRQHSLFGEASAPAAGAWWVVPVVQPQRVVTARGVVFVG